MYKLTHTIYDFNPEIIILYREINTNRTGLTGHRYTINIMYITSKIKKPNRIAKLWNSLPYNIVESKNLNMLKNKLDKLWSNQEVLYDYMREIDTSLYKQKLIN